MVLVVYSRLIVAVSQMRSVFAETKTFVILPLIVLTCLVVSTQLTHFSLSFDSLTTLQKGPLVVGHASFTTLLLRLPYAEF